MVSSWVHKISLFWRWLTIGVIACCYPGTSRSDPLPRSVLILNESSTQIQGYSDITSAQRSTLNAQSPSPFAFYVEYLSLNEFATPQNKKTLLTYLREKYLDTPIGIVAANGTEALRVALQLRTDERWSGIPIVFSAVDEQRARSLMPLPDVTGRFVRFSLKQSIDVARALVRNLQQVALVGDPLDRQPFRRQFLGELASAAVNLEIINLLGLPLEQVKKRVANLPNSSAILYTTVTADGRYLPNEALAAIAKTANRPIVVDVDNRLGHGATGGFVVVSTLIGEEAAQLMLRVFNGENPSTIHITSSNAVKPEFDWRELQRWAVNERDLPPDSEILFRPPTAWEQYQWQILLIAAALVTQSFLIGGLFYEHRRRHSAEVETRRRMAELALMNRRSAIGATSASIAHEINQPLAAITLNGETALIYLAEKAPNLKEVTELVQSIVSDCLRVGQVVASVRAMFKKDIPDRTLLDINNVIREVFTLLSVELEGRGVVVKTSLAEGLPYLLADHVQMQQVILNLIRNASEAMSSTAPGERILWLKSAATDAGECIVAVEDSGPGIDPEALERIFERFFTTKGTGMGMGLSICRSIVEAHGGRLTARRVRGRGMAFEIVLPLPQ